MTIIIRLERLSSLIILYKKVMFARFQKSHFYSLYSTSRFLSTRSSPTTLFHTSFTSSTTVSKCEVASYERVIKMLSACPELVGVYIGDIVTNLYYRWSIPEILDVRFHTYLSCIVPRRLSPGAISNSGLSVSTMVLTIATYTSFAQTLCVEETNAM
jgi:hypothetical protein